MNAVTARTRAAAALVWLALGVTASAEGATIQVPEDYPSVLAGMDAALPGDTVLVGPGLWNHAETRLISYGGYPVEIRSLCFAKSGVTLLSTHGPSQTVLDLGGEGQHSSTIVLIGLEDVFVVEGFTFEGRTASIDYGACIEGGLSAGVIARNCRFVGNEAPPDIANIPPVVFADTCPVLLESCEIRENTMQPNMLGLVYGIESDVTIRGCTFESNSGTEVYLTSGGPGDVQLALIEDSLFRNSLAGRNIVGGVHSMVVRRCLFERNSEGAIYSVSLDALVEFCTFAYDSITPGGTGAGVNVGDYEAEIRHCTFVGCHGVGGVSVHPNAEATVTSCVFAYSTGWEALVGSNVTSDCNVFWQNAAGDYGNVVPGPNDLPADPEFCDLEKLDLTVRSTSPCAPENSGPCGQIGAWGVGCGPVSVESKSWGSIKSLYR